MRYPKALLLTALVLAACEQANSPLDARIERQAAALVSHGSVTEPFSAVVTNPCNGEEVALSGSLHTSFALVIDGSGAEHFRTTTNAQGISGVGLTTGARYQLSGVETTQAQLLSGGTITDRYNNSFLVTAQGNTPNFRLHVTQHITVNSNGEVTAVVDNVTTSCSNR